MAEVTREAKVLLQSLAVVTAFLEYIEKRNNDRAFKCKEVLMLRDSATEEFFLKL